MLAVILATFLGAWVLPGIPAMHPVEAHVVSVPVHPYTEWGQYALAQAQKRYPSYAIVDYLHVGRTTYTSTYVKETFKFWLKRGQTEFGVYVKVYFDPNTNHVTRILFCETDR